MLMGCVVTLSAKDSSVSFNDRDEPTWSNVLINGNISITKQVSVSHLLPHYPSAAYETFKAGNGDLYLIDGAIYG